MALLRRINVPQSGQGGIPTPERGNDQ